MPDSSTTPEPSPELTIGQTLRELRHQRGLSLQQVALATGISRSFLSLVENGTNDITFGRLRRLIDLYGVDLADLIPPKPTAEDAIVRAADRRLLFSPGDGIDVYLASPDTRRDLLAGVAAIGPHTEMTTVSTHSGEEWVHVVTGTIALTFDDSTTVHLDAGDSAYLHAGRPHHLSNPTDTAAEVITVLAQGTHWRTAPTPR